MELEQVPPRLPYHTDDSWWRLLRGSAGELFILVNCEASFVSFELLIELNAEELEDYRGLGWLSLQHLANRVNYFANTYKGRHVSGPDFQAAQKAAGQ